MMGRVRFITHRGVRIVHLDFTNVLDYAEAAEIIAAAREFFAGLPPDRSQLTLTDVRGSRYNSAVISALRELAEHNKPFVHAAAVVADAAAHRAAIRMVALFTRRTLQGFEEPEAAKDWLVEQTRSAP
jgi:hypothetical protein